jgi:hypothetical protein
LIECNYQLINRSVVVNLDFILPVVDENVEIYSVLSMGHYTTNPVISATTGVIEGGETCWSRYVGPRHVLFNKTNGCTEALDEDRTYNHAVRAQMCLDPMSTFHNATNTSTSWLQEDCKLKEEMLDKRVQIHEIDGVHKIYCYPFNIEIEGEVKSCPNSAFILAAHSNYKIGNITHQGDFIVTTVTRQSLKSEVNTTQQVRRKRSPIDKPMTTQTSSHAQTTTLITSKTGDVLAITEKPEISSKLKNMTEEMNKTITRIKVGLCKLPGALNMTRTDFDAILSAPRELLKDSLKWLGETFEFLSLPFGMMAIIIAVIVLLPVIELVIFGMTLMRIPVRIWTGSARRVGTRMSSITLWNSSGDQRTKKKRWSQIA